MSTAVAEPVTIPTDLLEEMWDTEIPCGGVIALNIPPCGDAAVVYLDRASGHSRRHPPRAADYKCASCYQMWADATRETIRRNGGFIFCGQCGQPFRSIEEFARYRPIR